MFRARAFAFSTLLLATTFLLAASDLGHAAVFRVSPAGSGADPTSWAGAWSDPGAIDWAQVQPGDEVHLDGGVSGVTYSEPLIVTAPGRQGAPVTVRVSTEQGRRGPVRIFGGRDIPLPWCGQSSYRYDHSSDRRNGVVIDAPWVVVDGGRWNGLTIDGHWAAGARFTNRAANSVLANAEITNNGRAVGSGADLNPDGPGVRLSGESNHMHRLNIHDNGQDAVQSRHDGSITNARITESWMYNVRPHPERPWESSNFCTHADAVQIYSGRDQSGFEISDSVLGPGLMNSIIMGEPLQSDGNWAAVSNVTLRNLLVIRTGARQKGNAIYHKDDTPVTARNWLVDRVTVYSPIHRPSDSGQTPSGGYIVNVNIHGTGHVVKDSIISHGVNGSTDPRFVGNCWWGTHGHAPPAGEGGMVVDPAFRVADPQLTLSTVDDFTPAAAACAGKGASTTSIDGFLAQVAAPAPIPPMPPAPPRPTPSPGPGGVEPIGAPAPGPGVRPICGVRVKFTAPTRRRAGAGFWARMTVTNTGRRRITGVKMATLLPKGLRTQARRPTRGTRWFRNRRATLRTVRSLRVGRSKTLRVRVVSSAGTGQRRAVLRSVARYKCAGTQRRTGKPKRVLLTGPTRTPSL